MPLRYVEDLLNTRSLVFGTDDLASPEDLAGWLAGHELLPGGAHTDRAHLRRAVRLREGLRAVLAGGPQELVADFDALAYELPLVAQAGTDGAPLLIPRSSSPATAALTRLLAIAMDAVANGTWDRFKVCRNPDCRWAYYDHSRNKSRSWCSMETCGNQAKARAFRSRQ